MNRNGVLTALVVLLLGTLPVTGQEQVDNPLYKHWSSFKPGSFVKLKSLTKVSGQESVIEISYKLLEVTPEHVSLAVETAFKGQGMDFPPSKTTQQIPAKIDKTILPEHNPDWKVTPLGEDNVEVKGKSFAAKRTKLESQANNMNMVTETWESDAMPGGTVKMTAQNKIEGMNTETEMTVIDYSAM